MEYFYEGIALSKVIDTLTKIRTVTYTNLLFIVKMYQSIKWKVPLRLLLNAKEIKIQGKYLQLSK